MRNLPQYNIITEHVINSKSNAILSDACITINTLKNLIKENNCLSYINKAITNYTLALIQITDTKLEAKKLQLLAASIKNLRLAAINKPPTFKLNLTEEKFQELSKIITELGKLEARCSNDGMTVKIASVEDNELLDLQAKLASIKIPDNDPGAELLMQQLNDLQIPNTPLLHNSAKTKIPN